MEEERSNHQKTESSESGFSSLSECSPSSCRADAGKLDELAYIPEASVQQFLQTWTDGSEKNQTQMTLLVDGMEVKCTALNLSVQEAEKLLSHLEESRQEARSGASESMPLLETESDQDQEFRQPTYFSVPEKDNFCDYPEEEQPPSLENEPLQCEENLMEQENQEHSCEECSDVEDELPMDLLAQDLACSSTSSSSDSDEVLEPEPQPDPDLQGVATKLDGIKLKINLRALRKEEVLQKLQRLRNYSSSSSTSCSLHEEDLSLLSDYGSSTEEEKSPRKKKKIEETRWLPYREPLPTQQEEFVKHQMQGMLEYDVWLEQRRLLYSNFVPELKDKMPTNMQPRVVIERCPAADRLALQLVQDTSVHTPEAVEPEAHLFEEIKDNNGEVSLHTLLEELGQFSFTSQQGQLSEFDEEFLFSTSEQSGKPHESSLAEEQQQLMQTEAMEFTAREDEAMEESTVFDVYLSSHNEAQCGQVAWGQQSAENGIDSFRPDAAQREENMETALLDSQARLVENGGVPACRQELLLQTELNAVAGGEETEKELGKIVSTFEKHWGEETVLCQNQVFWDSEAPADQHHGLQPPDVLRCQSVNAEEALDKSRESSKVVNQLQEESPPSPAREAESEEESEDDDVIHLDISEDEDELFK